MDEVQLDDDSQPDRVKVKIGLRRGAQTAAPYDGKCGPGEKFTILLLSPGLEAAKVEASVVKEFREFFRLLPPVAPPDEADAIVIHSHWMPILYRRHARARHYVLRLHPDKTVMVTIPRLGTRKFAREFVASRKTWLEKQWRILEARRAPPRVLRPGMEILLGGRTVPLELRRNGEDWELQCGPERAPVPDPGGNLRPALENHLRNAARIQLARRVRELALAHPSNVKHIVIRNQKSRWGSCSRNGAISLNWRLIQLPGNVRDYIIIHELMHLRELNHSPRFWREVGKACPDYRAAEDWLKRNSGQVGF